MAIWIILRPITLTLRETILSNLHSLQSIQSNQLHLIHILKALITNCKYPQINESSQIQYSEGFIITAIAINNNLFHS